MVPSQTNRSAEIGETLLGKMPSFPVTTATRFKPPLLPSFSASSEKGPGGEQDEGGWRLGPDEVETEVSLGFVLF